MFIFTADFTCYCRLTFVTSKLVITNIIHSLKCIYCNHVIPHDFVFEQMLVLCLSNINLILVVLRTRVQQCPPTYEGYLADISDHKKSSNSVQIFTKQVWLCKGYESHYVPLKNYAWSFIASKIFVCMTREKWLRHHMLLLWDRK